MLNQRSHRCAAPETRIDLLSLMFRETEEFIPRVAEGWRGNSTRSLEPVLRSQTSSIAGYRERLYHKVQSITLNNVTAEGGREGGRGVFHLWCYRLYSSFVRDNCWVVSPLTSLGCGYSCGFLNWMAQRKTTHFHCEVLDSFLIIIETVSNITYTI